MYTLDPHRIYDRKIVCNISRKCRYHYRRCKLASLRAARLMPSDSDPAIWRALRPVRVQVLAERAAWRFHDIGMKHYNLYVAAANEFMGING